MYRSRSVHLLPKSQVCKEIRRLNLRSKHFNSRNMLIGKVLRRFMDSSGRKIRRHGQPESWGSRFPPGRENAGRLNVAESRTALAFNPQRSPVATTKGRSRSFSSALAKSFGDDLRQIRIIREGLASFHCKSVGLAATILLLEI